MFGGTYLYCRTIVCIGHPAKSSQSTTDWLSEFAK